MAHHLGGVVWGLSPPQLLAYFVRGEICAERLGLYLEPMALPRVSGQKLGVGWRGCWGCMGGSCPGLRSGEIVEVQIRTFSFI